MNGQEAAVLFRAMADRLEKNDPKEFNGAFLIVPPSTDGTDLVVDGIYVSTTPREAVFWSSLAGQVEVALKTVESGAKSGGGFGRR